MRPSKTSKSNKHYDWAIMPNSYIATALLLNEQLLKYTNDFNIPIGSEIFKMLKFSSSHPNYELVLPMVFNFKHGIELSVKYLGVVDYGKYQNCHDLKELTQLLKSEAKGTRNQKVVDDLYFKIWPIIKKYYYGRYIPLKRKSGAPDRDNQAERYPEYEGKLKGKNRQKVYRIPDRGEWVTKSVLSSIKKDIEIIEKSFADAERKIQPSKKFIYGRGKKFIH